MYTTGKKIKIACQCWFTTSGEMTPLMFKYEDENGEIKTIRKVFILRKEKLFSGCSPITDFFCKINLNGMSREVTLSFCHSASTWEMII